VSSTPGDQPPRISEDDRDLAVRRLQEAYAEEQITYEEMDERLHRVLTAKTHGELGPALASLPDEDRLHVHTRRRRPWVLLAITAFATDGFEKDAERSPGGGVTAGGDTLASSLGTGDCLPQAPQTTTRVLTVEVVPCAEEHDAVVFAVFEIRGDEYPGDAQVLRLTEGGCVRRHQEMLPGAAGLDSSLYFYLPSRDSWRSDRRVVCIVAADSVTRGA
jgi:hypothetical protein